MLLGAVATGLPLWQASEPLLQVTLPRLKCAKSLTLQRFKQENFSSASLQVQESGLRKSTS